MRTSNLRLLSLVLLVLAGTAVSVDAYLDSKREPLAVVTPPEDPCWDVEERGRCLEADAWRSVRTEAFERPVARGRGHLPG